MEWHGCNQRGHGPGQCWTSDSGHLHLHLRVWHGDVLQCGHADADGVGAPGAGSDGCGPDGVHGRGGPVHGECVWRAGSVRVQLG